MVHVDERKLREMAKGIDELLAHHREYDELDVDWLTETAHRLREMAAPATVVTSAGRVRTYLDAHVSSHRNPDVLANLVPDKPNGRVIELRVNDVRELLGDVDDHRPPRSGGYPTEPDPQVLDNLRQPGAFGGPPL